MHVLKIEITDSEYSELRKWRHSLSKTNRSIVREALDLYFVKQQNSNRGLDLVFVPKKPGKKTNV